jgi:ABC-2 type transport system permease protein
MSATTMRIGAILWKEWHELRQLKAIIWGTVGMPLLFTIIPLGALFAMRVVPATESAEFDDMIRMLASDPGFNALSNAEKLQVAMGRPMSTLLLLLPVMIPSMVASYSIVGEKTSQTLEPLLATPIRTWELLLAKMLTALIPTVILTWLFAGAFALGARFAVISDGVYMRLFDGPWLVAVMLMSPALSLLAIAVTVGISSRAKDPRSAQEVSALLIVPIVLMIPAQIGGLLLVSGELILVASLVIAVLAAIAVWIVQRLFDREWILTRWR